jgi:hypothetical protein
VAVTPGCGAGVEEGDLLANPIIITVMLIAITIIKAINAIFTGFFI